MFTKCIILKTKPPQKERPMMPMRPYWDLPTMDQHYKPVQTTTTKRPLDNNNVKHEHYHYHIKLDDDIPDSKDLMNGASSLQGFKNQLRGKVTAQNNDYKEESGQYEIVGKPHILINNYNSPSTTSTTPKPLHNAIIKTNPTLEELQAQYLMGLRRPTSDLQLSTGSFTLKDQLKTGFVTGSASDFVVHSPPDKPIDPEGGDQHVVGYIIKKRRPVQGSKGFRIDTNIEVQDGDENEDVHTDNDDIGSDDDSEGGYFPVKSRWDRIDSQKF
jgi:hypothetical protein